MPAAISHYLLALKALDKFEKSGGIPVNKDAFLWGAQGPDFLFYHIPFFKGSLRVIGSKLHKDDPAVLLNVFCEYYNRLKTDLVRSYILGFLCHYSLDRTAHPFIYSQIQSMKRLYPNRLEMFLHCKIETSLDVILLRYETSCMPTEFNLRKTVPENHEVKKMIADLYAYTIKNIFDKEVPLESIMWAMRYNQLICSIQNDRTGLKKYLSERLERKSGKFLYSCFFRGISEDTDFDYANLLKQPWQWPSDSKNQRTDSFLDLFEFSVAESVDFMQNILDAEDIKKFTKEIPFS